MVIKMTQKKREERAVKVIIVGNTAAFAAGLAVFILTKSKALFLDAFYSGIALVSSVIAYVIARVSKIKTEHYPNGLHFAEPLYAVLKSLLTLALLVFSVYAVSLEAWRYFAYREGIPLNIGPIIPYAVAMAAECFFFAYFTYSQNKKINFTSTILSAECKTCYVDGLQSLGIGVAAVILKFIDVDGVLGFLHYTGDFFITVILAVCSVKEPLCVLKNGFLELSGGLTDCEEIQNDIKDAVRKYCDGRVSVQQVHVVKTGVYICVYIYAEEPDADSVRNELLSELCESYENIRIVFCR